MKKKNSKSTNQQNNKVIWTTVALVMIIVVSCLSLAFISTSQNSINNGMNNGIGNYQTYQTINSDKAFSLLEEQNTKNYFYIGRDTCPYCSAFVPKLNEAIKKENALVYYYDTAAARSDDVNKLNELMDKLDVTSVPALLKIENGKVVSRLGDYEDEEAIAEFLR